jgi:hypothetical protein
MKSSDKKLIAAANLVEATGAEICIDNCRYRLTPQDLVLYTKDHEAFYAVTGHFKTSQSGSNQNQPL